MKQEKFKIYKTKAGKYYFILFAPNGQALTKSYNYASEAGCYNGIACVQKYASTELIENEN